MERSPSGLFLPPSFNTVPQRRFERTVTLPNGKRAKVTVEGTPTDGLVQHIETDDGIDAVVRPRSVTVKVRGR